VLLGTIRLIFFLVGIEKGNRQKYSTGSDILEREIGWGGIEYYK